MGRLFLSLLITAGIVWGITSAFFKLYTDPFGMTTREEVRSYTTIETTRLETQAEVAIANTQAHAQIETARLWADAAKVQAREERLSSQVWADVTPLLLFIFVLGGALWLFIIYRGQMLLVLARQGITLLQPSNSPRSFTALSTWSLGQTHNQPTKRINPEEELARYAAQHNQTVRRENGYYLLVDNATNQVVKQLSPKDW